MSGDPTVTDRNIGTPPLTMRDALRGVWEAARYPIRGNEDWRAAAAMDGAALERPVRQCRRQTIRRNSPGGSQPFGTNGCRALSARTSCRPSTICSNPRGVEPLPCTLEREAARKSCGGSRRSVVTISRQPAVSRRLTNYAKRVTGARCWSMIPPWMTTPPR